MLVCSVFAAGGLAAQPAGWPEASGPAPFAPAMRACLAGEDAGAFAVSAMRGPDGAVMVRLRRPDGTMLDCRVAGGLVVSRERPASAAPPPGPGAPAFFLDRRCVDARRVDRPDGAVLGWLAYPGC